MASIYSYHSIQEVLDNFATQRVVNKGTIEYIRDYIEADWRDNYDLVPKPKGILYKAVMLEIWIDADTRRLKADWYIPDLNDEITNDVGELNIDVDEFLKEYEELDDASRTHP